jgi:hypothetical protein
MQGLRERVNTCRDRDYGPGGASAGESCQHRRLAGVRGYRIA